MVFFGLVNAPIVFQAYINLALRAFTDIFTLAYFDNILIFFKKKGRSHGAYMDNIQKF